MANKYVSFLNTLLNEDNTLSGIVVTDNNGYGVRWGLNEKFHPGARLLSFEKAMMVYDSDYWPTGLSRVYSQVLANMVFDFGFNHGKIASVKTFQGWLKVTVDGVIGSQTVAAANRKLMPESAESLASAIDAEYRTIGGSYLDEWEARVIRNMKSWGY